MAPGKSKSRQAKKSKAPGKKKMMKSRKIGHEIASLKQTISFRPSQNPSANTLYGFYNWSLQSSNRAIQVARAYQEYRIKQITIKFKPKVDTFATDGANNSIPYLYYRIDKTGTMFYKNTNFASLRESGCKPIRFDDKTITVSFAPSVLQAGFDANPNDAPWTSYKISPWLTTNKNNMSAQNDWEPNGTDHLGIFFGLEQDNVTIPTTYDVDMIVHYQFRKPRSETATATGLPNIIVDTNVVDYAETNPEYTTGMLE